MKRVLSAALAAALLLALCSAALAATVYTEGYFYYTESGQSVTITGYFGKESTVTVPSFIDGCPVNTIAAGAFSDSTYVKTVNLPDTVTTVETGAFSEYITVVYSYNNEEYTTRVEGASEDEPQVTVVGEGADSIEVTIEGDTVQQADVSLVDFSDVYPGDYYYAAVTWAVSKNITKGTTAATFSPNATCTRGQIVTFLWRTAGCPSVKSGNPFKDVKSSDYCYQAVLWAAKNNITGGTGANTFSPNATCTRGQIVTFLWRYLGSQSAGTTVRFTDVKLSAYYAKAVAWAYKNDITGGTSADTFSPDGGCTRAQAVTFLYRAVGK